jgi:hypothetical protein
LPVADAPSAVTIPAMPILFRYRSAFLLAAALTLCACSPDHNWREVHGQQAPFTVLLPAKPATHAQPVNLDGIRVTMNMTAAEVNGVMFAVGSAELPDPAQVQPALKAMKTAMVRNIGGSTSRETPVAGMPAASDIEADGSRGGRPLRMVARFTFSGKTVYQAVIVGPAQEMSPETVDTFLRSFKPGA